MNRIEIILKLKKPVSFIKKFGLELLLVLILFFVCGSFLKQPSKRIMADGFGYYDYLPSIFIYQDFFRKDIPADGSKVYDRIKSKDKGVFKYLNNRMLNKYPVGTAILCAPFFGMACIFAKINGQDAAVSGSETVFSDFMLLSAFVYLFLALLLFKHLLKLFGISKHGIRWTQLFLVFSTSVVHYIYNLPTYSHIYSLTMISGFLLFSRRFFMEEKSKDIILAAMFFGLVILVRQANAIIILFLPFIAGDWKQLIRVVANSFKKPGLLFTCIFIVLGFIFVQSLAYYAQTGYWWLYSYQTEGFNFLDPQFTNILFSYKKGLFIYTPVLLMVIPGLYLMLRKKEYFLTYSWLGFTLFLVYFLSSWWAWSYGGSFGHRAFIDFYPVLFFPIAFLLDKAQKVPRTIALIYGLATIPILLIQLYQYQNYILTKNTMDAQKYWKVFLKTNSKYRGLLWKKTYHLDDYAPDTAYIIGDKTAEAGKYREIFVGDWIPKDQSLEHILRLSFENDFIEDNDVRILMEIKNNEGKNIYYSLKPLIHYANSDFGYTQSGFWDYKIKLDQVKNKYEIRIFFKDLDQKITIRNTKLEIKTPE